MRETGSESKKWSVKKFRGVAWGYMIRNQISPDFRDSHLCKTAELELHVYIVSLLMQPAGVKGYIGKVRGYVQTPMPN